MKTLLINGTIVTMDPARRILTGDLLIENEKIAAISAQPLKIPDARVVDCTHHFVIPGLIQAHIHLVQTAFRGKADDLVLLDWLKKKIWPMEAAHTAASVRRSAQIGLHEMQLLGTTTILDMGTVHHTDSLLQAVEESGMRYYGGKCLMDLKGSSGPLYEERGQSLKETRELIARWHRKTPLMDYALCPRFAVSCSDRLLRDCAALQKEFGLLIHTHASESLEEIALIRKRTGLGNVDFLEKLGLLNERTVIVHGVHLSKGEVKKMIRHKAGLVHCPSSNLKLASGIAPIEAYQRQGMKLAVGADGAACNNTLDPFMEVRLMALLQKPRFGPEALPAQTALEIATLGGARVLGREHDIGSLEVGKLADVITVDRTHPSVAGVDNPYSALVYSCSGRDVQNVWIHGRRIPRTAKLD